MSAYIIKDLSFFVRIAPMNNKHFVRVAHSPDADDIFMYYALAFGWVDCPDVCFENLALDIETLNENALRSSYEISAISFALYPLIAQNYALLRTGVSFGQGYGPKLIKRKGTQLKKNFKVALSGAHTTNALLFQIAYPDARVVYKNFLDIESAVVGGEVDAGVLIHESILNFDASLCVEREIWEIWENLSGGALPLPLGGMAILRSIPLHLALQIEELLTKGVAMAHHHPQILSNMLHERKLLRISGAELETYLRFYANEHSISLDDTQLDALDRLFALGHAHGFYPQKIAARDFLLPSEYMALRHS